METCPDGFCVICVICETFLLICEKSAYLRNLRETLFINLRETLSWNLCETREASTKKDCPNLTVRAVFVSG